MSSQVDLGLRLGLSGRSDLLQASDDCKNLGFAAYSRIYHGAGQIQSTTGAGLMDCEFNINVIFQHLLYSRDACGRPPRRTLWEHKAVLRRHEVRPAGCLRTGLPPEMEDHRPAEAHGRQR